ncbi:Type III restriction-modification system methylation subunit [Mucinivorans hirudinis]|uniref:site-specific DNA-methyltransferase (adenine-specific) n=1 Tax=Mucinivorans hirudinis TaxID=1433126 RepID=A0A060R6U9_9BACT|nr:Type III restriction-modification system methylation subunit [Mucinivorans hirudinis]
MNKLKMESMDMTQANIDKIAQMFPQVVTEVAEPNGAVDENGKPILKKAIDFEKLKLVLSAGTGDYVVADDERERYEFTWVGKRQAMIDAATPIRKTLRPCPDESKDWATTENLYIEGDNLEVLKLLQESYLGKVKMIYIDPPYNTGKDFIYKDNFAQSREEYEEELDMFDEEGNRLFQNTETNGRFHSDWCSMIYPRLQLARNLLTDDGVIFISIDDNEVENLKKIGNEVFGESNFLAQIVWQKKYAATNDAKGFSTTHDYITVYQKSSYFNRNLLPRTIEQNKPYKNNDNDGKGLWRSDNLLVKSFSQNSVYPIVNPNTGEEFYPAKGSCWRASRDTMDKWLSENRIYFGKEGTGAPQLKRYLNEVQQGKVPITWWTFDEVGHNDAANKEVSSLFQGKTPFDTPKPVSLLRQMLVIGTNKNDIILDFFSGSATTAHAVMQLNAEDGGNRKFIMVQLPEVCDPNSEAAKAGCKTICEIGKERIRRAGQKITEDKTPKIKGLDLGANSIGWAMIGEKRKKIEGGIRITFPDESNIDPINEQPVVEKRPLDTGFRVFKLDTTNMKDVYYAAGELSQTELWDTVSNIKDDRSDIDLLYGCLLDWGVQLTMPHTTEQIENFTVHTVDSPLTDEIDLIACFDTNVSETVVRTIAKRKPTRALFRDSSFADSANKINVFEIFKSISPDTTVKVI